MILKFKQKDYKRYINWQRRKIYLICNLPTLNIKYFKMTDLFFSRRNFLKDSATIAAGTGLLSSLPSVLQASTTKAASRIKFSVIAINHGHIYGMIKAVQNGGGELVAVYAKEPE